MATRRCRSAKKSNEWEDTMSSSSSSPSYSSESSDSDYKYSVKRKKRSKKTNAGTRNVKKPSGARARQKTGSGSGQNATGDAPHHDSGCCTSRPASTATTNDSRSVSSASVSHSAPSLPAASSSRSGSAAQSEPSPQHEALRKIRFAACLNTRLDCQLQVLYVKLDKSETNKSLHLLVGWNDSNNLNFQCAFCPTIEQQALKISTHINDEHPELIFAMNKSSLSQGNVLYLHCRHCPFVAVDSILMWVHFEFYHALPGILSGPLGVEVTPKPTRMQVFDSQQKVVVSPFYCCLDCGLLVADSRHGALHVVQTHGGDTDNFNGCFVRMNMYNKLPKSPSSGVTYANVLEDKEYKDLRREIFVCVLCTCIAYTPYLAVVHHIRSHVKEQMIYSCPQSDCDERFPTGEEMITHFKNGHSLPGSTNRYFHCSVTLIKEGKQGDKLECFVSHNRNAN